MDRFVWTSGLLEINETLVIQQRGVRIYDGEEKVGRLRGAAQPAGGPPAPRTRLSRAASRRGDRGAASALRAGRPGSAARRTASWRAGVCARVCVFCTAIFTCVCVSFARPLFTLRGLAFVRTSDPLLAGDFEPRFSICTSVLRAMDNKLKMWRRCGDALHSPAFPIATCTCRLSFLVFW